MEWLAQNWTYLLLLVGVILFIRFGGLSCGFGGRRAHSAHGLTHPGGADTPVKSTQATDPVSRRSVDPQSAVATLYQGRAYYFESRENRDRFDSAPQTYVAPASGEQAEQGHRHQVGGCC